MRNLKAMKKKGIALALMLAMTISVAVPAAAEDSEKAENEVAEKVVKMVVKGKTAEAKEEEAKAEEPDFEAEVSEDADFEETEQIYSPDDLKFMGVIWYGGHRFTWYSEKVLPGPGLNIPGRHVDENGYVCDEDDFICVATRDYAQGTELDIPFGKKGKVYDWCPSSGTIDVYVSW